MSANIDRRDVYQQRVTNETAMLASLDRQLADAKKAAQQAQQAAQGVSVPNLPQHLTDYGEVRRVQQVRAEAGAAAGIVRQLEADRQACSQRLERAQADLAECEQGLDPLRQSELEAAARRSVYDLGGR